MNRYRLGSPRTGVQIRKQAVRDGLRIVSVTIDHFDIPVPKEVPLTDALHGEIATYGLVTARVKTEDGFEGLGYITLPSNVGASALQSLLVRDLAPEIIGMSAAKIEQIWGRLVQLMSGIGRGGLVSRAISVLDIALWDLKAKRCKIPLYQLIGGFSDSVQVVASGVDLTLPLKDLVRQTEEFIGRGFLAIKMKIGRASLKEDVQRVRAIRAFLDNYAYEIASKRIPLMASASGSWTLPQAQQAMRALGKFGLDWIEEPINTTNVKGFAKLSSTGGIALCAGETVTTERDMKELIEQGGISYCQLGVNNVGGVTPWIKLARLAELNRVPVTSYGPHNINVHLMAALPNATFMEVSEFRLDEFCNIKMATAIKNGQMSPPDLPGLGIALDFKALDKFRDKGNPKVLLTAKTRARKVTAAEATSITKRTGRRAQEAKSTARSVRGGIDFGAAADAEMRGDLYDPED